MVKFFIQYEQNCPATITIEEVEKAIRTLGRTAKETSIRVVQAKTRVGTFHHYYEKIFKDYEQDLELRVSHLVFAFCFINPEVLLWTPFDDITVSLPNGAILGEDTLLKDVFDGSILRLRRKDAAFFIHGRSFYRFKISF